MDYPRVKFDTQFMPTKLSGFGRACPRAKIYTQAHAGPGIRGYPDPWVKLRSLILFMKKKERVVLSQCNHIVARNTRLLIFKLRGISQGLINYLNDHRIEM